MVDSSTNPSSTMSEHTPIPQPRGRLFLGNLLEMDPQNFVKSLQRLAGLYGPIFQLKLLDNVIFIGSQEMVHAICDEDKFQKFISAPLAQVRNFAGDGLFTAFTGEHNWTLAHRVLIPAFGPIAIKKMQGMMMDIITQMLMSWEHHAGEPFTVADQYTRLTFDTIGWAAFRYRFNSFHTEGLHPFVNTMVDLLSESGLRSRRPEFVSKAMFSTEATYQANIAELHKLCDEIVAARRRNPDPDAHDLLNNMINDKDPKTGEQLSDENIRFQMVTFLIAGHETTSGMLSFATYYMLKNPSVFVKARKEADKVIEEANYNLLKMNPASLTYIDAICKEALRLQPSAPAWTVSPKSKDGETLPGGYFVPQGREIAVILHELHRDPKVYGADAETFRPERWLEGKQYPPDSWKPFGNGSRACIGRGFAMQEAVLALALIVARFDLEMDDPAYDLEIKQTLTIKPDHFKIVARPRLSRHQSLLAELISGGGPPPKATKTDDAATVTGTAAKASGKLYALYGSNSGSCEGLAREVASEGRAKGFTVEVAELDSKAGGGRLPTDAPVIICTASYEGKPTDNARMFVSAIQGLDEKTKPLEGVKFLVMGAGHHDWASTFHKVPKYVDSRLEELGAERLMPLSVADAGGDLIGDFDEFKEKLWEHFGVAESAAGGETKAKDVKEIKGSGSVKIVPPTANPAGLTIAGLESIGTIVSQETLVEPAEGRPQTNFITIQLPNEMTYRTGDYLAVLAKNPQPAVDRALKRYGLNKDDHLILEIPGSYLPLDTPIRAEDLFSSYAELGQPVSKRVLPKLAPFCKDPKDKEKLKGLEEDYTNQVTNQRLSLLDLLDVVTSAEPPLEFFVANLPKMNIRQYSISSTPLDNPYEVSLTFTVHTVPNKSGKGSYLGVASNYLAFLDPGATILCAVKSSADFHPPADPTTPVVMFAAGSGFAPFRGFIEERSLQKKSGRKIGPTVLFYGCRSEDDMLHRASLCRWVKEGVLDLHPVFSRSQEAGLVSESFSETATKIVKGTKYVQHRVWEERDLVRDLFEQGAQFYTCGSGAKLGADLRKVLVDIIKEEVHDGDKAEEVMEKLAKDRYKTDVFL